MVTSILCKTDVNQENANILARLDQEPKYLHSGLIVFDLEHLWKVVVTAGLQYQRFHL